MSSTPETEFDLEKLFLPAWAQESPSVNRYAKHTGEDGPERRSDDRPGVRRGPRRDGPLPGGGPKRDRGPQGERRGPRREGDRPQRSGDRDRRGPRREDRALEQRREPPAPLPEVVVTLM